jgi:hypothetical protein
VYGILSNADVPWPTIKLANGTEARLDASGYTRWRAAPGAARQPQGLRVLGVQQRLMLEQRLLVSSPLTIAPVMFHLLN